MSLLKKVFELWVFLPAHPQQVLDLLWVASQQFSHIIQRVLYLFVSIVVQFYLVATEAA